MNTFSLDEKPLHFIRQIIHDDVAAGRQPEVVTRFPPEPNGYLHIGHAKAICLDFGMAREFGGRCHLRMDDTNPAKEEREYIESIQADVRWLGFDWGKHFYHASDFFGRMYEVAERLIEKGAAYVCDLTAEEWKEYRGVPTRPGRESPYRNRSVAENLDLFRRMRAGEFREGERCLRAKMDMASPNIHLRDPVIYRILRQAHPHTGAQWCVYPTYDFAHPLEDAFEGVTHSLCTLEFEVHRPLYDWVIEHLDNLPARPRQYEFARLNLTYTIMSKRKLLQLVREKLVGGWDDPRLPTLCGLRRRGYPPAAIRDFCERVGVTKYESLTDVALLEHCVRDELNRAAPRRLAVMRPLKLIIENYPADRTEEFPAVNNPENPEAGTRRLPFSRELWIERDDFMEDPPKNFYRLAPGREVRLRYAYCVTCAGVERDAQGNVIAVRCAYDPQTRGGNTPDGRKIKATIHWVSAAHAVPLPVRQYDRLFTVPEPDADPAADFTSFLNPDSLRETTALGEPDLAATPGGTSVQFERVGYYYADHVDARAGRLIFNQIVPLKDSRPRDGVPAKKENR